MRIGIVNDSLVALEALRLIVQEADLEVAWLARDGQEAVEACGRDRPDIVLMDLVMPRLDGVGATKAIMQTTPCPILVVTASIDRNVGMVFAAMGAGAIDVVNTPEFDSQEGRRRLLEKIEAVSTLSGVREEIPSNPPVEGERARAAVLIGSSAGGPVALLEILCALPQDLRAAVVIVQHVDERFAPELARWLRERSRLPVGMAEEGGAARTGEVFVSRGGAHLSFGPRGDFVYANEPRVSYQPSVDVFFQSAIRHGPRRLMGVLLTGMGRDGAVGLKALREAGHLTVAQDEASSAIYGMPRAAAEIGAAQEILPLSTIPGRILQWTESLS